MATFPASYVSGAGLSGALQGTVNLNTDSIKVALFGNTIGTATPSKDTAHAYGTDPFEAADGQVSSAGYTVGGQALNNPACTFGSGKVIFDDAGAATMTWNSVTFTARGALVYSATASNLVICAINFNSDRGIVAGNFTITWDGTNGIFYVAY